MPEDSTASWTSVESQHYLRLDVELVVFELCLIVNALVYSIGLLTQRLQPSAADSFLVWFTRPFLLLYVLVFSPIGTYINIYAFSVSTLSNMLLVGFTPPAIGYIVGGLLASLVRRTQNADAAVDRIHLAVESSICNTALVSTIVRFGVKSEVDADTYAAVAMLVTCATPATICMASLVRCVVHSVGGRLLDTGPILPPDHAHKIPADTDMDELTVRQEMSKSRTQTTQVDDFDISVIVTVDEKVTVI